MALRFPYKDPNEVLDFVFDWSERLETGDAISTSVWSVVTEGSGLITIDSETQDTTTATVWLSAGTVDTDYELLNRVVTSAGRTMDQTVRIRVRAR